MEERELLVGIILGVIVLVLVGEFLLGSVRARRWPTVTGELIGSAPSNSQTGDEFEVRARFHATSGEQVEGWAVNRVTNAAQRAPGTQVTITHHPKDPRRFYVEAPGEKGGGGWLMLAFLALAASAVLLFVTR